MPRKTQKTKPAKPRKTAIAKQWIRTPNDRLAVKQGCCFDLPAAERVRTFFKTFLVHSKGEWAGKPFELLDWQWRDVVAPLFGWKRPDGSRRFRRGLIAIPKKNGKSTLLAGLGLYMLMMDGEGGAEVYTAAADREQASIVFNESANMAEKSTALSSRLAITRTTKTIGFPQTQSRLKALSADAYSNEGLNASAILFDELHAQKKRDLWDTLKYAGTSRRQPLNLAITTAGFDKLTICYELWQYALAVLKGEIQDTAFLSVIYAAEPEDAIDDPATWEKCNPSLGYTITRESMAEAAAEAKINPAAENAFRRYRLNQWTEQDVRWLSMENWKLGQREIDPAELAGLPCYAGLDLSSTSDLTAFVLVFPGRETQNETEVGVYTILPFFWCPEEKVKTNDSYRAWAKAGWLESTPGNVIDYDYIRARISGPRVFDNEAEQRERLRSLGLQEQGLGELYGIQEIAFDPWNATQFANQLAADGFQMIQFRQGFQSMNEPSKEFCRLNDAGLLRHESPLLAWNAENACVRSDPAANIKPVKPDPNSAQKIDGIVAAIMGLARAMFADRDEGSTYDERPLLIL